MDQQQVHIIQAQTLQRTLQARDGAVVALEFTVEFRRDEEFAAVQSARADAVANAAFVAVLHCGIDVPVPGFHGMDDGGRHLVVVQRPGAQANLGNAVAVIEFDERCECHSLSLSRIGRPCAGWRLEIFGMGCGTSGSCDALLLQYVLEDGGNPCGSGTSHDDCVVVDVGHQLRPNPGLAVEVHIHDFLCVEAG